MGKKRFEVDLPDEVRVGFGWQEGDVSRKVLETLVMELLRRDQLSESEAAALLHLDRWEILEVMGRYRAPAIRMSPDDLQHELAQNIRILDTGRILCEEGRSSAPLLALSWRRP
jgi:hypothetical protein